MCCLFTYVGVMCSLCVCVVASVRVALCCCLCSRLSLYRYGVCCVCYALLCFAVTFVCRGVSVDAPTLLHHCAHTYIHTSMRGDHGRSARAPTLPADIPTQMLGPGSVDLGPGSVDLEPGSVDLGPGSVDLEPISIDLGAGSVVLVRVSFLWGPGSVTLGAWELTHVQRYTDIGGHLECESQPVTSPANQHHMSHANLSIYIDTCAHINTYIHAFINCLETRGGQRLRANSTSVAESLCIPAPCHLSPGPRQPIPAPNQPAPAPNQPSPAPSQLRPAPNQLCSDLE